jgi:small ligand-binding sensory domain FIST
MPITKTAKAFASSISVAPDWRQAARDACLEVKASLGAGPCGLALVFVSEYYPGLDPAALAAQVSKDLGAPVLGCNASGVIGGAREVEMEPAVSVLGMRLPDVKLTPFRLSPEELAAASGGAGLVAALDLYPTDRPNFICLADPMSCDVERLLSLFNEGYPGRPVIGGLSSAVAVGAPNWLCVDGEIVRSGAVGVALSGGVEFETIVSQGCRPVGKPMIVTKADQNVIFELAGKPAFEALRETVAALPDRDRRLARDAIFVGLVINEYGSHFNRGDFLVRNLLGFDAQSGALAVGAAVRRGQTVQFQLRDAETSEEDLRELLGKANGRGEARGAFLVSCCGRGRGLYGKPDHDIKTVLQAHGPLPLAGFFANGEFGPVGGRNFVHGYTSSLVFVK